MYIKNRKDISTSKLKSDSLTIVSSGLESVQPEIMLNYINWDANSKLLKIESPITKKKYVYKIEGRIFIIGAGKASSKMAEVLENIFGEAITTGIVLCNNLNVRTKKVNILKATHPYPSYKNLRNTLHLLDLVKKHSINEKDLVLCLISGGGSSMLEKLVFGVSLHKLKKINKHLLASGESIHNINLVRKLLSEIKAGGLALQFSPAKIVSLIISDVIDNRLEDIASGPTVLEDAGFAHKAEEILEVNGIEIPFKIEEQIGQLPSVDNILMLDKSFALENMFLKAKKLGYSPVIIPTATSGLPENCSIEILHESFVKAEKNKNCFIFAGEPTPKLPFFHGKGGRNQHLVLCIYELLSEYHLPWCVASISSDGSDYIRGVSGAIIDHRHNLKSNVLKYLKTYNSYKFFKREKVCLIKLKNSFTNIGDLGVLIK